MADLDDDLSFDSGPARSPAPPPPADPPWALIAGAGLLVVLGALGYFAWRSTTKAPPSAPMVAQTTVDIRPPRRTPEPGEAIDLPPLDQTDPLIRSLAGKLSSNPVVAAWLSTNGLIRNLTVVIANIAEGQSPAKHLKPLRPAGAFATRTAGGVTWIDPASYARYDAIAAAVDGLDGRGVARFYATIKPRIDDAYRDLAGADANFDRTVERAIVMLLRTPDLDENVQLSTEKVSYRFANPALEQLPSVQRQFLRMGPHNVKIIKGKLREIAGYLGIPDSALPTER